MLLAAGAATFLLYDDKKELTQNAIVAGVALVISYILFVWLANWSSTLFTILLMAAAGFVVSMMYENFSISTHWKPLAVALGGVLVVSNLCSGGSGSWEGTWEGTKECYQGRTERYTFELKDDGTCVVTEKISGDFNNTLEYKGKWEEIDGKYAKVHATTLTHSTYSTAEIERETAKAQTPWALKRAYKRTSGYHTRTSSVDVYISKKGDVYEHEDFSKASYKVRK